MEGDDVWVRQHPQGGRFGQETTNRLGTTFVARVGGQELEG
jgi:hypothetical protein